MKISIVPFNSAFHRKDVVQLWKSVFGYETDHNDPELAIDRKLEIDDDLFFVAVNAAKVVGTIMAGYDGHRGWLYALAVSPDWRNRGVGSDLIASAEVALTALGCMKINLQIIRGNEAVEEFYRSLGYKTEKRISMGKKIPKNIPRV